MIAMLTFSPQQGIILGAFSEISHPTKIKEFELIIFTKTNTVDLDFFSLLISTPNNKQQ